jgi:hypothetical protein
MITLSIDVTLLDKSRIKEVKRQNGQTAKFVDLVLIDTPDGKFGDYMVKQSVTKEEREAKVQMPILGNAKNVGGGSTQRKGNKPSPQKNDGWDDQDNGPGW